MTYRFTWMMSSECKRGRRRKGREKEEMGRRYGGQGKEGKGKGLVDVGQGKGYWRV